MTSLPSVLQQWFCTIAAILIVAYLVLGRLSKGSRSKSIGVNEDTDGEEFEDQQELCSSCGYDVRGLFACPECGKSTPNARRRQLAKLRNDWPTEHIDQRLPQPGEEPIIVLEGDNEMAIKLLREHLTARGIPARMIASKKLPGALRTAARKGYVLTVWTDDEERARAIIEHLWPEGIR